jgi:hypothetical protein
MVMVIVNIDGQQIRHREIQSHSLLKPAEAAQDGLQTTAQLNWYSGGESRN